MSVTTAREIAIRAVGRVRRDGAWIQAALESELSRTELGDRDRAFATASAYGTIAHLGTVDDLINDAAARPSSIEPQVRDALRVAVHELFFMGTPARATVSEAVNAVRRVRPRAAGYANAVLRTLAETAPRFPFGDPDTDIEALARLTGHPAWMASLFSRELGDEVARNVMRADAERAPLYLAHNPFNGDFDELVSMLEAEGARPELPDVPGSVLCREQAVAVRSEALRGGRAIVCDLAAQAIIAAVASGDAASIADIAAGRGTKTVLLQAAAVRSGRQALITAVDTHAFKLGILERRMSELAVPDVVTMTIDATDSDAMLAGVSEVDLAFVDAPCSGLGTLRRHPEKRWTLAPSDIDALAQTGAALLRSSARVVRPGGFVVYSTCTVTRSENVDVVETLLGGKHPDYEIVPLQDRVSKGFERWVTKEGFFQSLPEPGGPDGHFAALLRRIR